MSIPSGLQSLPRVTPVGTTRGVTASGGTQLRSQAVVGQGWQHLQPDLHPRRRLWPLPTSPRASASPLDSARPDPPPGSEQHTAAPPMGNQCHPGEEWLILSTEGRTLSSVPSWFCCQLTGSMPLAKTRPRAWGGHGRETRASYFALQHLCPSPADGDALTCLGGLPGAWLSTVPTGQGRVGALLSGFFPTVTPGPRVHVAQSSARPMRALWE